MSERNRKAVAATLTLLLAASPAASVGAASSSTGAAVPTPIERLSLPWRQAGLTERQAAAHLLDRLSFGARPGEIDRVLAIGLERWVEGELAGVASPAPPGEVLARELARLPALTMPTREIAATYPPGPALLRMAERAGVISREAVGKPASGASGARPDEMRARRAERQKVEAWMEKEGLKSERELLAQSYAQKLLRAVYAESQLHEVLADFWFNHFNVSTTDDAVRSFLLTYERDAIRPHLADDFGTLLEATAKHPAMLAYLDNFQSVANPGQPTLFAGRGGGGDGGRRRAGGVGGAPGGRGGRGPEAGRPPVEPRPNRPQGLNENYARELLELHTLGVDGGYTQQDVVEVARAFTGWSFVRVGLAGDEASQRVERLRASRRFGDAGFVSEGEFLFRADAHDAAAKSVLGVKLPAGRGIEDGEQVLDLLAAHPATARHLARKLAVRFVADEPPAALVDRLAATFTASRGDLERVLRALVESPEFWDAAHRGQKIKSPFEVAVSALRALDATVDNPFPTLEWVSRMGQVIYAYQAPTGFPDRADFWVNTGALLSRMNYGLDLAAGRIGGVRFDLAALNDHREPESAAAALATYAAILLPERATAETVARLEPLLARPELPARVAERSPEGATLPAIDDGLGEFGDLGETAMAGVDARMAASGRPARGAGDRRRDWERLELFPAAKPMSSGTDSPTVVAGVVGLLLGSPEFQRR